jgi:hypothetical protein
MMSQRRLLYLYLTWRLSWFAEGSATVESLSRSNDSLRLVCRVEYNKPPSSAGWVQLDTWILATGKMRLLSVDRIPDPHRGDFLSPRPAPPQSHFRRSIGTSSRLPSWSSSDFAVTETFNM